MAQYVADFKQTDEQIIMGLINNDNGTAFTAAQIIFGEAVSTGNTENDLETNMVVTAASGSGYTGSVTVKYNRVGLGFMADLAPDWVIVTDEAQSTDLIALLNEKFGINLQETDIVDEELPVLLPDAPEQFVLQAAAESKIFAGEVSLTLAAPTEPLSSVLTITDLDGLYAPAALPAVQEPEAGE